MKLSTIFILTSVVFILNSCSSFVDPRDEYSGDYSVKLKLEEGTIPKEAIKDSINAGLSEVKEALKKAKLEMNEDLNLDKIDTTTAKGKIEYAAKVLGKGVAEFGLAMGEFGSAMGELAAGIANGSLNFADGILNNLKFDVTLNKDGTIKTDHSGEGKVSFENSTWEVDGKTFYLISQDKEKEAFEIVSKKDDGFVLKKEKLQFVFTKLKKK